MSSNRPPSGREGSPGNRKLPLDELLFGPEWCHSTLASIGDGVITTDTDGQVTFLNPVAASLTGWAPQDAAGQPLDSVFRIINEVSRLPVESPTVRALRDGVVVGLANHKLLVAKDGTERPIDDRAAPIRNDKGAVAGVVLVFRDVAAHRRDERQVQDALTYADNIIATLRHPFLVLDQSLRVKSVNASFCRTFHVSMDETEGCFIYDLGERQWDIPRLRTLLEEVLPQNNSFQDFVVEHTFPTIGEKIMLLNASRFVSANSQPELILLAIEDITEHRRAEVAVQTSEVRYRRLFETARDGVLILDANSGRIIDANPFMTRLLGYSHQEFLGKELWEIGVFGDKLENEAAFRTLQEHGYIRYDHLPLASSRGKPADVEFVSNVYYVDHRHVAQCNIRDISERTRLERQTKQQATELSDLHRRKDEFLAMLSHELRNPLAPMTNAVHLLRLQAGTENLIQQQSRTIIERQLGQLKHLVDDLMEVSRMTTGRVRLRQERVVVSGIVAAAVETVRPLIDRNRHELSMSVPREPIWLLADAARLEQVLVNLLTNAAKFTDDGGQIWLVVEQEGADCVIRVRDTGVGIAAELLPRIFDLFTQAERSMDRSQGGLGIGLALVQRLVELHGGATEVTSVLGQGSEFVVRLAMAPTTASQRPPRVTHTEGPVAGGLNVLVVDDSVDMAESMAMLVKAAGHDVRTVYDGSTALEVALDYRPDAVLLDIGLPGLNGYEVAKSIRQQQLLQPVTLIAVTGYGQGGDREASHEAGFDHHLVKPAEFKDVQSILATISKKVEEESSVV
jgi:PAS domain S-box-containing protein